MKNTMLMLTILLLAPIAMGGVQIESENMATPWAVVAPGSKVISRHTTRDKAIEDAVNQSESHNGAVYRVVYMRSLRVRHVPGGEAAPLLEPALRPDPGPAIEGGPLVRVLDPDGQKVAEFTTVDEARADAAARAQANRDQRYVVAVAEIGLWEQFLIAPPPPPAPIPPAPVSDFDLAPYLAGAQMVYVDPTGTGDGSTPAKAMTLAAAQTKYLTGSGNNRKHVALRLANGVEHAPGHPHLNNCMGVSDDKPLVICPQDLNGAPPRIRTGFHLKEGYGHVIFYGLDLDGTTTWTDPDGNVVTSPGSGKGFQCSTVTDASGGTVRLVRSRVNMWSQAITVQNQTGGTGKVAVEVWDSIISRTIASGMYTLGGDIRAYNTWFIDCGSHGTKDHGLYITDSGSFVMDNCGAIDNSAAGLKIQTMRRGGPYLVRGNLFISNGEVAVASNVNASSTDPGRHVGKLVAEGNLMTNSHMRMFDIGANRGTTYRKNRVIDSGPAAWLYNLQSGGSNVVLTTDDVTLEDSSSYNAGSVIVYSDGLVAPNAKPYENVKVGGLAFVYTKPPANAALPNIAAVAATNTALGFAGVTFTAPNLYAADYIEPRGFAPWNLYNTGRKSADWWRANSPETFTTVAPNWKDPGRSALRYNAEVLGGAATMESLRENIYAGKVSPRAVREWIEAGYVIE